MFIASPSYREQLCNPLHLSQETENNNHEQTNLHLKSNLSDYEMGLVEASKHTFQKGQQEPWYRKKSPEEEPT